MDHVIYLLNATELLCEGPSATVQRMWPYADSWMPFLRASFYKQRATVTKIGFEIVGLDALKVSIQCSHSTGKKEQSRVTQENVLFFVGH